MKIPRPSCIYNWTRRVFSVYILFAFLTRPRNAAQRNQLCGVSFALPLLRRRFKTLRPCFVAILFLKPCTFVTCLFLGWYVLFIYASFKDYFSLLYKYNNAYKLYFKSYALSTEFAIFDFMPPLPALFSDFAIEWYFRARPVILYVNMTFFRFVSRFYTPSVVGLSIFRQNRNEIYFLRLPHILAEKIHR